jgi:DNA-binding MarR family transcriptional regulator
LPIPFFPVVSFVTQATLGTLLRNLVERLDGAVDDMYAVNGLAFRPRYAPVLKYLLIKGPSSIAAIAQNAGTSHSAISQTVAQMKRDQLVSMIPGQDSRERIVSLTQAASDMAPALQKLWVAVDAAAAQLDKDLSAPLSAILVEALTALDQQDFANRISAARDHSEKAGRQ